MKTKSRGHKRAPARDRGGAGKRSSARLQGKSSKEASEPEGNATEVDAPTEEVMVHVKSNDEIRATASEETSDGDVGRNINIIDKYIGKNIDDTRTISDEDLFAETPHKNCEICKVQMNWNSCDANFQLCCGKEVCYGCMHSKLRRGTESYFKDKNYDRALKHTNCPFCGEPCYDSDEEGLERLTKLLENDPKNGHALHFLAFQYANGLMGLSQDMVKANNLWTEAGAELGDVDALNSLGNSYNIGRAGFEIDDTKAKYYYSLSAMKGHMQARYNVGYYEEKEGNMEKAVKHYIISTKGGFKNAKWKLMDFVKEGHLSQAQLDDALDGCKKYKKEVMTDERNKAWLSGLYF